MENEKVKKFTVHKDFLIQVNENGSIGVFRIYDNVKEGLRDAAQAANFKFDPSWTTRQLGKKLINELGENKAATIGNYVITEKESGSIEIYRTYDNTKEALREISSETGFEYDPKYTTRQLGSKLIDYINNKQ